jgi:hypothetical protein
MTRPALTFTARCCRWRCTDGVGVSESPPWSDRSLGKAMTAIAAGQSCFTDALYIVAVFDGR